MAHTLRAARTRGPDARPRAAREGLTAERKEAFIGAYRRLGVLTHTCKELGISESRLHEWRGMDPEFAAALVQARKERDERVGEKYVSAIEQHVDEYLAKEIVSVKRASTAKGEVFVAQEFRAELNPALATRALGKLDPAWAAPRQVVEHTGTLTLTGLLAYEDKHGCLPPIEGEAEVLDD